MAVSMFGGQDMKKLLPILIALLVMMPWTVYADPGDFLYGSYMLDTIYVNKKDAPTVWYGGNQWRIVAYDSSSALSPAGGGNITLLASGLMGQSKFSDNGSTEYAGSRLKSAVETVAGHLTAGERGAVIKRTLDPTNNEIQGAAVTNAYVWPLSYNEASNVNKDLRETEGDWWLRSPGNDDGCTMFVMGNGSVIAGGRDAQNVCGVRPALYLKKDAVLFLTGVADDEWKCTVSDQSRSGFEAVTTCRLTNNVLEIEYNGAKTGTNEYISAVILGDAYEIKHYEKLTSATSASGTVTIDLSGKYSAGDTLYVFNEQVNAEHETNYASALNKVVVANGHDWEFTGFTWTGDATRGYTKAVANYKCRNNKRHVKTVNASITKKITAATCTEDGKTVFTASVKASDSPDKKAHTENKEIQKPKATGHSWGDWKIIKQPTETATGEKQRVCKNNSSHVEKESLPKKETEQKPVPKPDPGPDPKPDPKPAPETEKKPAETEKPPQKETESEKVVSGIPLAKLTAKGKKGLKLSWLKVDGADGYDIFFAECGKNEKAVYKNVKTVNGNSVFSCMITGLKAKNAYKAYVRVFVIKNGIRKYVGTSPSVHAFTSGSTKKYTNAKSVKVKKKKVTVKKGKTYKIKATVKKLKKKKKLMPKKHTPKLRYLSTDSSIATVSKKGKIKGIKAGTCYVYVLAHNGVSKKITVTVK